MGPANELEVNPPPDENPNSLINALIESIHGRTISS